MTPSSSSREQLHRMRDFQLQSELLSAVFELKHATGISRCQYIYMRFFDLFHLSVEDFHREFVLGDVVNPRTSAALVGAFDLDELNARNRFQQYSRFVPDSLTMKQMTRIVVSHATHQWSS